MGRQAERSQEGQAGLRHAATGHKPQVCLSVREQHLQASSRRVRTSVPTRLPVRLINWAFFGLLFISVYSAKFGHPTEIHQACEKRAPAVCSDSRDPTAPPAGAAGMEGCLTVATLGSACLCVCVRACAYVCACHLSGEPNRTVGLGGRPSCCLLLSRLSSPRQ